MKRVIPDYVSDTFRYYPLLDGSSFSQGHHRIGISKNNPAGVSEQPNSKSPGSG
jgi:hypothetical protein